MLFFLPPYYFAYTYAHSLDSEFFSMFTKYNHRIVLFKRKKIHVIKKNTKLNFIM